jgi:hypothetical protein
MLTALRDIGLIVWRFAAITFLLMSIACPPATYLLWRHGDFLNKLHTEGIEANATIVAARVQESATRPTRYYLDLSWPAGQGKTYSATDVEPSLDYAKTFTWFKRINVNTLPIKYLAADPKQFILYLDPKNNEQSQAENLRLAGLATAIGFAGLPLFFLIRRYERKRMPKSPQEEATALEGRQRGGWIFMSLLFYAALIGLHLESGTYAKIVKVPGAEPLGIPVKLFVIAAGTILYLPVIWALWHFSKIAMQAHKDGKSGSKFYLMTGGGHGHLRGSAGAAWFGLLYFVAICVAWIAFAEMKRI